MKTNNIIIFVALNTLFVCGSFSCNKESVSPASVHQPTTTHQQSASLKDLLCKKWKLIGVVSDGIYTQIKREQVYAFNANNTFSYSDLDESGSSNIGEGAWAFNDDSTKLAIQLTRYNNQNVPTQSDFSFQHHYWDLKELANDKLIEFHQGREEASRYIYIPYFESK